MSNIVIFLDKEANRAEIVHRLQKATHKSLSDILSSLANNTPFLKVELFEGDYDSHAKMIRAAMDCVNEFSLSNRIYELPEGETMESCEFLDKYQITPAVLENILSEADTEIDRQLDE